MNLKAMVALAAVALPASLPPAAAAPKLPLHPGFYVESDVPCGEMYQAAMIQFTGTAFEEGPELCRVVAVSHRGSVYRIAQRCQDQMSGTRSRQKGAVAIPDRFTFLNSVKSDATRFRYCPLSSLPGDWKGTKETVPNYPAYEP